MEEKWSLRLIRVAAIFGLIGTVLGSHMAGAGSPVIPSNSRTHSISRLVVPICLGRLLSNLQSSGKKTGCDSRLDGNYWSNRSDIRYVAAIHATVWSE